MSIATSRYDGHWSGTRTEESNAAAHAPPNREGSDRLPTWRVALVLAPLLFLSFSRPFVLWTDPDYWWHLPTGAAIVANRALPWIDPYSFTAAGQPWVTHEWLSEVVMYLVSQAFGYVGNAVLFGLIAAASQLLIYLTCRARGVGRTGSAFFLIWAFVMTPGLFNVVPQVLSILFLALTAYLLLRYRQGQTQLAWILPPLVGLWGNFHGGFLIGLGLIALTILGEALERWRRRPSAPIRPIARALVLSVAAVLINPNGPRILLYSVTEGGPLSPAAHFVSNFQAPDFHDPTFLPFLAALLLTMGLGLRGAAIRLTDALWVLVLSVLAMQSARHVALYAVIVLPFLAGRLAEVIPVLRRESAVWRRSSVLLAGWLVVVATVAPVVAVPARRAYLQLGREASPAAFYPAGGVAYLKAHPSNGNLFSEYAWGGYLINQLYPARRVFIDGRIDVYGLDFAEQYLNTVSGGPGWRAPLDRYDIQTALVDRHNALSSLLAESPDWKDVYSGPVEKIFVRTTKG